MDDKNDPQDLVLGPVLAEIRDLRHRAASGEDIDRDRLRHLLDANPQVWRGYSDLAGLVQDALIRKLTDSDVVACESLRLAAKAKRDEILGDSRSPLERLLADQIVTLWLHVNQADLLAIDAMRLPLRERKFLIVHRERAHRQLQRAVVSLASVRRMIRQEARGAGKESGTTDRRVIGKFRTKGR